MSKIEKLCESNLFNDYDLDLMCTFSEQYYDILNEIEEYKKLSSINSDLNEKLNNNKDFEEYETNSYTLRQYECCLMYYLGIKKGLGLKKLK